jgi:hypothetical protein
LQRQAAAAAAAANVEKSPPPPAAERGVADGSPAPAAAAAASVAGNSNRSSSSPKSGMQLAMRYGFALCLQQQHSRQMNQQRGRKVVVVETMEDVLEKAEHTLNALTTAEQETLWDEIEAFAKKLGATQNQAV